MKVLGSNNKNFAKAKRFIAIQASLSLSNLFPKLPSSLLPFILITT